MKVIPFFLLFLLSCGDGIPINYNPDIHKIHDQDKSMIITQAYIEEYYEVNLGRAWEEAEVFWTDTICPYRMDQYAVVHENRCYYGIMWGCRDMYVALSNKDPIRTCGSALTHEFGHCLRGLMGLDPQLPCPGLDASHKDKEFWSVISKAHEESCIRDW